MLTKSHEVIFGKQNVHLKMTPVSFVQSNDIHHLRILRRNMTGTHAFQAL